MQKFNFSDAQIQSILSIVADFTDSSFKESIPTVVEQMFDYAMHSPLMEDAQGEDIQKMYYAKNDVIRLMNDLKEVIEVERNEIPALI